MASKKSQGGRRVSSTSKKTSTKKTSSNSRKNSNNRSSSRNNDFKNFVTVDDSIRDEAILLCILGFCILVYLALFGALSSFGKIIASIMFGIFGLISYIIPVVIFLTVAFYMSNRGRGVAYIKVVASIVLTFILMTFSQMLFDKDYTAAKITEYYTRCASEKKGGGILGGVVSHLLNKAIGGVGTTILLIVLAIVCIVLITEKSFFTGVRKSSETIYYSAKDNSERYRESRDRRRREREEYLRNKAEAEEENKVRRRDKHVSGVMLNTTITPNIEDADDIRELTSEPLDTTSNEPLANINIKTVHNIEYSMSEDDDIVELEVDTVEQEDNYIGNRHNDYSVSNNYSESDNYSNNVITAADRFSRNTERNSGITISESVITDVTDDVEVNLNSNINITGENIKGHGVVKEQEKQTEYEDSFIKEEMKPLPVKKIPKRKTVYKFPPMSMLKPGVKNENTESVAELKETAARLQATLKTFGVNVNITDIAQGPSVTRYEMQPEVGTKVSKITNLTDDIKLNMAAKDIRIEAPIPGKAAVGIELPNKEVSMVSFRDLIESKEFKEAGSKISFAVGKDLSGSTVVADIGKMPHMLIAGSTGSGKSVCINTLIMSIIYKANPDEVKLIMVDPKIVELSVYNGIPHLMIPVVTDPKKAAAALNWGVAEMTDRYNKFAEFGVRDLKGYNKKLETVMADVPEAERPKKLPQIVIIVDELADLMMVASNEVETAICRLAQLARAAGIHLVIATQRPSVDVITGLIKANMPSRIAFAVSSGVDSRTILDMNGAERLLGKGDMLFYPQGYTKPARVQGAFISDEEIIEIVEFLKANTDGESQYDEEVLAKVNSQISDSSGGSASDSMSDSGSDRDQYFIEAAKLAIDQDKASIGYFQRKFKIGFNRAARIMDQLYEAGIVSAEEGTKPRRVLMSMEQFENALEQGEL